MKIRTPHDRLFRAIFSQPRYAAELCRMVLPPALMQHLDFTTMRRLPGDHVDSELREHRADLVFEIAYAGSTIPLFLLIEHQSQPHPRMPYRLSWYTLDLWDTWQKEWGTAKPLPLVIPLVVHHGQGGWGNAPRTLGELQDVLPEVAAMMADRRLDGGFLLADLALQGDEDLLRHPGLSALPKLALWCLKHGRRAGDPTAWLHTAADLMMQVPVTSPEGDALITVSRYILQVVEMPPEHIQKLLEDKLDAPRRDKLKTAADQLREEGSMRTLLKQLRHRFGDLPLDLEQRIQSAGSAQVDRWSMRVLDARSLDEVFAEENREK